ncbi:MAG TPA: type I restriction-modification system subunit M N-terminal domain-containing protein, partial [Pirellulales bacterium]
WNIADPLRGAMNADDFRDYMLSFLFLRYLSDNTKRRRRRNWAKITYPDPNAIGNGRKTPLSVWYADNQRDVAAFEKQMRRKVHYVVKPDYLLLQYQAAIKKSRHLAGGEANRLRRDYSSFAGQPRRKTG